MICPNCGTEHEMLHPFCYQCGAPLSEAPEPQSQLTNSDRAEQVNSSPVNDECESAHEAISRTQELPLSPHHAPRKGRHWPPAIIMAALICCGLLLFWLNPINTPQIPSEQTASCFSIHDGVLSFHPEHYSGSSEVTVPEVVNGQPVTEIGSGCFSGCSDITTVILPDTVTTIQHGAFYSCRNLRGIQLPDGVTFIGEQAFQNCPELEAIYIGSKVEFIGNNAFSGCRGLKFIIYSDTLANWFSVYDQEINENVEIHAQDGTCKQVDRP